MAIIQRLPVAFKGAGLNAPKLTKIDRIESNGSLLLIDPTHPSQQWVAGVPTANADTIPNLLASKFTELTGVTTGLAAGMYTGSGTVNIKKERTSKGGLHTYVKPSLVTNNDYAYVSTPASILTYMNAHKDRAYYFSLWQRTTMATSYPDGAFNPTFLSFANSTAAGNYLMSFNTYRPWSSTVLGSNFVNPAAEDNHLFAAGAPASSFSIDLVSNKAMPWMVGWIGPWNGSGTANSSLKLPSQILYRVYIEDLTISGRSYADVFAIDQALYTKEVLTSGGRYYGDTFTNPASAVFA